MNDEQVTRGALDSLVDSYESGELLMPDGEEPRIFGSPRLIPALLGDAYRGIVIVRHVAAPGDSLYIFPASHIAEIDRQYRARMEC